METYTVFRLEKFIPTHCPKCAHPFKQNGPDFGYDFRLHHPRETPAEWQAVFPEAAVTDGLQTEPIWCRKCQNITLRVITALRHVATAIEAQQLEALGYANRQPMECTGVIFSRLPEYTLSVKPDPDAERGGITFFPRAMGDRRRPRSS